MLKKIGQLNDTLGKISERKLGFVVFFAALAFSLLYNELNLWASEEIRPGHGTVNGATIYSIDNEYYLTPVENFLESGEWCRSPCLGEGTYVRRTPGYSIWYLLFRAPFGPVAGLYILRIFQLLLFAFSAVAFYRCLLIWGCAPLITLISSFIYTCLPTYSSYGYYTLTESLAIPLCILYLWSLFKGGFSSEVGSTKIRFYIIASLFGIFALLTRPFAGVLLILLPIFLYWELKKGMALQGVLRLALISTLGPALIWSSWVSRNYVVTDGDIVILERYSDPTTYDIYKPGHNAMWDLVASWGGGLTDMAHLRTMLIEAQHGNADSTIAISAIDAAVPQEILQLLGPERFKRLVLSLQNLYQRYYSPRFANMDRPLDAEFPSEELALADSLRNLRREFIQNNRGIWLKSFGKLMTQMAFHSASAHIYFVQEPFRSRFAPIKIFLGLLLIIHTGLFSLFLIGAFIAWKRLGLLSWLALFIAPSILIFSLLYLGIVEQRYTYVVEPLMLIAICVWISGRRSHLEKQST